MIANPITVDVISDVIIDVLKSDPAGDSDLFITPVISDELEITDTITVDDSGVYYD